MTGKLILIRHQESEWNKLDKWTGRADVHLSEQGYKNGEHMGFLIKDLQIDKAYTSALTRTIETLNCLSKICKLDSVPTEKRHELNERDYGDYTGKNKLEMKKILGEEKFNDIRRGWNCPIPGGETLSDVYNRVVKFYQKHILPELLEGKSILIVAHGNSLRALVKFVESISNEDICNVEFSFDKVYIYTINNQGKMLEKRIRDKNYETI